MQAKANLLARCVASRVGQQQPAPAQQRKRQLAVMAHRLVARQARGGRRRAPCENTQINVPQPVYNEENGDWVDSE